MGIKAVASRGGNLFDFLLFRREAVHAGAGHADLRGGHKERVVVFDVSKGAENLEEALVARVFFS